MVAPEHLQLARQFLIDADKELDAGDVFQASEKLWGAASHMVIAEMHRRGIKQSGHRTMVQSVGDFGKDFNDPVLRPLFTSAEILHANIDHGFLEHEDIRRHRNQVHSFVERMNEHTNGHRASEN